MKTVVTPEQCEFTIQRGMKSASYLFTEEGDLLMMITPRDE